MNEGGGGGGGMSDSVIDLGERLLAPEGCTNVCCAREGTRLQQREENSGGCLY